LGIGLSDWSSSPVAFEFITITMDEQASASSGAIDQRRQDALKGYRDVCIYFSIYVYSVDSMHPPENAQP